MLLTWSWKLRPTRAQHALLSEALEMQRLLYNAALEERRDAWRKCGTSITLFDQNRSLTTVRADDPAGYGRVAAVMSRWTLHRLDDAMRGFFRRVRQGASPGFPRFRSQRRWRTFGFDPWAGISFVGDRVHMKGFDRGIRVNMHRRLPEDAQPKRATVTRKGRHWFFSVAVETSSVVERHVGTGGALGIDAGLTSLATFSDGIKFLNPRPGKREAAEVRRASRALSRCMRGSRRREKVRARLARVHRKIANARATHLHRVSAVTTRFYPVIVVEDLDLRQMMRSPRRVERPRRMPTAAKRSLNRSLGDTAIGKFITMLAYKAERSGGRFIKVDPRFTSQDCSACGERVPKALWERTHHCPSCGLVLDRDWNAARNILARGRSEADAGV